ncbi:hypothetical protein AVEN_104111-1 [Araneus ventricosus]|uniref:Uncharacterized protein n=1 Tax=Araneus ventricosus TaxID=182803 RepID=A0A4Y2JBB6_ARAVE|nr:hypothetical protein AVEN_104111-1 [Araneus ventricosus]
MYFVLVYAKSVDKRPPTGVVRKFGEEEVGVSVIAATRNRPSSSPVMEGFPTAALFASSRPLPGNSRKSKLTSGIEAILPGKVSAGRKSAE